VSCRNWRYFFSICTEMWGKTMKRFSIVDVLSETRTRVLLNVRQKRFLLRHLFWCDLSHEQNVVILISPKVVKFKFIFFLSLKIRWFGLPYEKFRVLSDELLISSIFYHISLFHPNSPDQIRCPSTLGCNSNLKTGTEKRRRYGLLTL